MLLNIGLKVSTSSVIVVWSSHGVVRSKKALRSSQNDFMSGQQIVRASLKHVITSWKRSGQITIMLAKVKQIVRSSQINVMSSENVLRVNKQLVRSSYKVVRSSHEVAIFSHENAGQVMKLNVN